MDQARFPDLSGASVLVTGGGSGIGAAITEGFARQGARVAFIDIAPGPSTELAARLAEQTGMQPLHIAADITDTAVLAEAVDLAVAAHGPVSILVNNAARDDRHAVGKVSQHDWDANHAVNLRAQFFAAQAVADGMKAAGKGAIVNLTSTGYMMNVGDYPVYAAAKAGVVGLTKSLAGALGPHGIRVNALAPGWVMTERQRELWATPADIAAHVARQCLRREIAPADMVGPCLFLASDASAMMTAQTIIVDGGIL